MVEITEYLSSSDSEVSVPRPRRHSRPFPAAAAQRRTGATTSRRPFPTAGATISRRPFPAAAAERRPFPTSPTVFYDAREEFEKSWLKKKFHSVKEALKDQGGGALWMGVVNLAVRATAIVANIVESVSQCM